MPTKMVRINSDRAVFVTVYVEKKVKLIRRRNSTQFYHNKYDNIHIDDDDDDDKKKGYNRKAELLRYSRRLRNSATITPEILSQPKLMSDSCNNQKSKYQMSAVRREPKRVPATPACCVFGCITSFQPKSRDKKQKTIHLKMKILSLEVQKTKRIVSKLFKKLLKHR